MMYKRLTADRRDIGLRYAPRPRGRPREGTRRGTNLAAPRHAPRARRARRRATPNVAPMRVCAPHAKSKSFALIRFDIDRSLGLHPPSGRGTPWRNLWALPAY